MHHRIEIAGVGFDNVTEEEALERIKELMGQKKPFYVVTPNPEFVLEAQKNECFKKILNEAALAIPDGTGILWAASFLERQASFPLSLLKILVVPNSIKNVLKTRVTGTDLMERVIAESSKTGWRVFLLGGKGEVTEKARQLLEKKYPGANLVSSFSGDASPAGDAETIAAITQARPDVVFVAYGAPKQEEWIERNLKKIPSVTMAMGVGGAFDFISGKKQRAPRWMRQIGLEWAWRLGREPWRMMRIWRATVGFIRLIRREQQKKLGKKG